MGPFGRYVDSDAGGKRDKNIGKISQMIVCLLPRSNGALQAFMTKLLLYFFVDRKCNKKLASLCFSEFPFHQNTIAAPAMTFQKIKVENPIVEMDGKGHQL